MSTPLTPNDSRQPDLRSLKNIVTAVYALQAASFFLVLPYFIAVILDYIKRDDAHGTWLESHFRWQMRTFSSHHLWVALGCLKYINLHGTATPFPESLWLLYNILV